MLVDKNLKEIWNQTREEEMEQNLIDCIDRSHRKHPELFKNKQENKDQMLNEWRTRPDWLTTPEDFLKFQLVFSGEMLRRLEAKNAERVSKGKKPFSVHTKMGRILSKSDFNDARESARAVIEASYASLN